MMEIFCPQLQVNAGAFKVQAHKILDSKLRIMHFWGKPAVRAGFVPLHVMTILARFASLGSETVATAQRSQHAQRGLSASLSPRESDRVIKAWVC